MRRVFVDENLSPDIAEALHAVFKRDRFRGANIENLTQVWDVELFGELQARSFDAILTLDARQLERAEEREALRAAGLHWIGMENPAGVAGEAVIAGLCSMALAGLPYVFDHWATTPHAYRIPATLLDHGRPEIDVL